MEIPADRRFLSLAEAAHYVGLSPKYLKGQVADGKLRGRKTGPNGGGRYKFTREDLDAWYETLEVA